VSADTPRTGAVRRAAASKIAGETAILPRYWANDDRNRALTRAGDPDCGVEPAVNRLKIGGKVMF